ncbi:MAG: murein hydrolase activator EnvC family protein [Thermodesulfobacteriota bacterium]
MAVVLALAPAFAGAGQKVSRHKLVGKEKTLEDVKRRIRDEKKEVRAIERKESSILGEIERIGKLISARRREIKRIGASIARIDRKIRAANARIDALEAKRRALSARLAQRLRAMYMMRRGETMDVLFSAASAADLGRKNKYLTVIMDYDSGLISEYEGNLKRLDAGKRALKGLQAELAKDRAKAVAGKREAQRLARRKSAVLRGVQREKGRREKAVSELEQAARELGDLIGNLRKEGAGSSGSGFAAMKGRLRMPVPGKVVSLYGKVTHPKFRTITFNNGIVIEARVGRPVKSVYDGRVAYVGWLKGYGQVMIIDHGGGFYTLFAYLSEVLKKRGEKVEKGSEVALVGDTGPLASGGLYFEIRQKGVPRDPMAWLARR